jgi:integrase
VFGNTVVTDILPVDLENYQITRLDDGLKPATVDMELTITKTMISKAFDNDKVSGRVLKRFRAIKKLMKNGENARRRIVSIEEYKKLLKGAGDHTRNIMIVAYNTGMRPGEVVRLKWSYIDSKDQMIRLPKEAVKNGRARSIPINHHVRKVLHDMRPLEIVADDHHEFVFTYLGKPILNKMGIRASFKATCRRAGVPYGRKVEDGMTFHDFRKTVKTFMLKAGVRKTYRDLILGHSLKGMDIHYIAPSDSDLHEALGVFTNWLDQNITNLGVDKPLTNGQQKASNIH